jgi:hypothetical protein
MIQSNVVNTSLDKYINQAVYSTLRRHLISPPTKRQRTSVELVPIVFGLLHTIDCATPLKILLDSGASSTLIKASKTQSLKKHKTDSVKWTTSSGSFRTNQRVEVNIALPELSNNRTICAQVHVTPKLNDFDMIIGRDLLSEIGITLNFKENSIQWDDIEIPMKPEDATTKTHFHIADSPSLDDATERIKHILDAKYEAANLQEIANSCTHLSDDEQQSLHMLLNKYNSLFDGSLGTWTGEPYNIELKQDATPYHARAFPIPKVHEQTLKMEVNRLVELGVLKKVNRSEWAAPTFIIPKKDGTVRFISDFRQLNLRIRRKPYPIPKIQDLLMKLEGFMYATSLDLNMGYYHIELTPNSKALCTIVLPWGKYEYQRLPMGLCNSPDIFQEKMSSLVSDLEYCRAYIDDLLILTAGSWDEHLKHLDTVFQRLNDAGLKVNAKKSFFGKSELEYLGYWITRNGIQPLPKKIAAIQNLAPPTTVRELRRFIGLINYYRDMWIRRSEVLTPLTALVSKNAKWQWTDVEQDAFDTMKRIISREVLLSYPDFSKTFVIHTDASNTQLGAVISQDNRPIAFYSRKLNLAQTRYTTTERELLAIVETLKEFRNILLGQRIQIHTDHRNLTYKNFNTERVLRWRLILEEFGPELLYIKGEKNIVADALSRLGLNNTNNTSAPTVEHNATLFGSTKHDLPDHAFPVQFKLIQEHQQKDSSLLASAKSDTAHFKLQSFHGGGTSRTLICFNDRIVIPKTLQKRVVEWYHETLCHPGINRTEQTIRQHFWWKELRQHVTKICEACDVCQRTKRTHTKYGHLPEKEAEAIPWDKLCVDMIGPYNIKLKRKPPLTLWCVTMIDPATSWFEMAEVKDKEAITVASIVEQTWLTRYPWPSTITFDQGKEFMGAFAEMVSQDYGIKRQGITVRNPQANAVIERIHQTIANMIRTFEVQDEPYLDPDKPWAGILSATMFAVRATYHTTLQATPSQLVFGRDAILNVQFEANWNLIQRNKQRIIQKNNKKENSKRIPHEYKVNDKVLCTSKPTLSKFGSNPWEGPFQILKVNNNGTVRLRKGVVIETVNIRQIKPYHTSDSR